MDKDNEITIDVSDITLDDILKDTITIDDSMSNYTYTSAIGATGSAYGTINITNSNAGYNGTWVTTAGSLFSGGSSGLHVSSDARFDGDVKIKGVSILETLEKIEKRLAILRPDPEKLAHFESLRKAYEHYKTLEALCELPSKEDDGS